MKRALTFLIGLSAALALPSFAPAHELDHPAPAFDPPASPPMSAQSGGAGASWEFLASFPTGNPHTDLDFFTRGENVFVSVGTLAIGPNAGGQTILQLTNGSRVQPKLVGRHPSASCISNPDEALGLQHDVEAAPKGGAILNADVLAADRRDTQVIVDATDNPGRCHDQGAFGLAQVPQGGLEIVDVTDPAHPAVIGMTSHIGESHTVNVDPRRPHIVYAVTSDAVSVEEGKRGNEAADSSEPFDLDGFEVVDMSSCMNFAPGTALAQKRDRCRPQVYRYRYPDTTMSLGHTNRQTIYACHELEVYPDDRLTCASGQAAILLDLSGAFDDRGTPRNFLDDKPRGIPLPCRVRSSSSTAPFTTGAKITDCVTSASDSEYLGVPNWRGLGSPSLQGVRWLGSAFHQGRNSTEQSATPAFDSTEDIDFDHEAEFSASGRYILATDERGGGVAPPGASCSPSADNPIGNGGIHAYRADGLLRRRPGSAADAFSSYARNPRGGKAIFRTTIRTKPQASLCTAHVFQQIPGQNRIFMGWYSQGTHVVDFNERPDGRLQFREAGYFIPTGADEWVSHVFKVKDNRDGTFTYWGAAGDFALGEAGRSTIEVWKVTLPAPPAPRGRLPGTGAGFAPPSCLARRARLTRRGIGRLRLRQTRARTLRRLPRPVSTSRRRRVLRYCIKRDRRGRGVAVFDRRRRLRLAASSGRRHTTRGIHRGSRSRSLRRRYGSRVRRLGRRTLIVRGRRSTLVFGVRRGRVRYVAVADRRISRRSTLRRYIRLARLR
jgi:hypothetical protein